MIEDACEALGATYKGKPLGSTWPPGGLGVLSEQADDDRRGRRGHDARRGRPRVDGLVAQPGQARDLELVAARFALVTTIASTTFRPRSGSASSRSSTGIPRVPQQGCRALQRVARRRRRRDTVPDDEDHTRSWFVYVVKLPSGVDRDAVMARLAGKASPPRRTCPRSTCSRTCASATASPRECSRSARTAVRARWRCRSTRGSNVPDQERVVDALRSALG